LIFEVFQLKTRILQVWDDECSLKQENLAQARFCRSGPMKVRSSEILAVANLCISLALCLELAQGRFYNTANFESFVILKPFLAASFTTLNPSMSSD